MTTTQNSRLNLLAKLDYVFLGILLVAMSSQVNLGDIGRDTFASEGYTTKTLKIALPDIALLLNMIWFGVRTALARGWKRLWWPPLPAWALLFAMGVALVHSPSIWGKAAEVIENLEIENPTWRQNLKAIVADRGASQSIKEGIAETIQFGLYFLVAPLLLANLLLDRRDAGQVTDRRGFALKCFAAGAAVMILIALLQSARLTKEAPRALFGSPNAFAAWFAIAVPLLFAWAQSDEAGSKLRRLALPLGVVGALAVASLWSHLALIGGLVTMAFLARGAKRVRLGALAVLMALFVGVLWAGQGQSDVRRASFARVGSASEKVKKQYIEWYAASGWALPRGRAFASGVGPGNYQSNIGTYYTSLPNEEKMPPDSNSLYLVQSVSLGVLGLTALLWTLGHFARRANDARKYLQARSLDAWLPLGVLGSLAAWAIVNVFHAAIVRGTGLVLALLFALSAVALGQREEEEAPEVLETDAGTAEELRANAARA